MKTINDYTIPCTKPQTRKALKLGASIEIKYDDRYTPTYAEQKGLIHRNKYWYIIPTTEQMISWLEEQDGIKEITVCKTGMWIWGEKHTLITSGLSYPSRQESSLAAIDATLEYLEDNK